MDMKRIVSNFIIFRGFRFTRCTPRQGEIHSTTVNNPTMGPYYFLFATYVVVAYKVLLLSINNIIISLYAGSVMGSFYYASSPICGNWFQKKNQLEYKSDDRAGNRERLCLLPMENNVIWTSAANLINICHCNYRQDRDIS